MAASAPDTAVLQHYKFFLDYFPSGSSMQFNGEPLRMDILVLYYDLYIDGLLSGRTICGYLEFNGTAYAFESTLNGSGAYGAIYFPPHHSETPNDVKFYFTPNDYNISSSFFITPNAMRYCIEKGGLFNYAFSFFESLNGKYGSFVDGSLVTVAGRSGTFDVVASEIFWNDDNSKEYMMLYVLSHSSTKKILIVPEIHVSLKQSSELA